MLDMVLVMTVYPGFGGQKLIESTLDKVRAVRQLYPDMDIQVDGGVNDETLPRVLEAGANVLVMGTAFFKAEDPAAMVERVRSL
jgi:ribulose-phosphate 3-epimerase